MRRLVLPLLLAAGLMCWAAPPPQAAAPGGDNYLAEGGNPQRDAWQRNETILNTGNVSHLTLLWKTKLDSTPREMTNLFPPLVAAGVQTPNGTKQIAVVAGVSDDLWGLDADNGQVLWHKHFDSTYKPETGGRQAGTLCPGGQTANPVVGPGAQPGTYTVYAVAWDGRLWQVNLADGADVKPPAKFMPPNAKPYSLNLSNGVIYTSISQGCGGYPFAITSFDLATQKASALLPQGGGLWGRRGVTAGYDGNTVYMGTGDGPYYPEKKNLGDSIVAAKLDANQQLQLTGWFAPPNAIWMWHRDLDMNVSPMAFDYDNTHLLVATSKECVVYLLDQDNFGGADHRTALATTPHLCNDDNQFDAKGVWGAPAAWQDASGTQWVDVPFWGPVSATFHAPIEYGRPTEGGVVALKVKHQNGKWALVPAWISQNMDMGEEAIVANGIVFAYGSGEDTQQQRVQSPWDKPAPPVPTYPGIGQSAARIFGSTHATLYALDGQTGKTLWSSGDQIKSWSHFSGIAEANGRLYIPTYDGYVYCFGLRNQ